MLDLLDYVCSIFSKGNIHRVLEQTVIYSQMHYIQYKVHLLPGPKKGRKAIYVYDVNGLI